ncbi:MAG: 30S ribosomal protein S6 [Rhodospirillales bacterium]|nr:30S ribosomal protein S6 [Rhodospirillales bacterium]
MPYYECVFIARQDISAPQVEALTDNFAKIVEEGSGTVAKREYWGLRGLSFRIRKNRKGHYMLLNLDAPPAAVLEMERQMRLNEDIIRHLTIRVEELQEGPSAIMLSRSTRDDRPRRDDRFGDRPPREDRHREDRFRGGERSERRPAAGTDADGAGSWQPATSSQDQE